MGMKLSPEEVNHIATLARLGLSAEEKERLREQLSNILENMEALKEVDTTDVPPTAQSIALQNVFRDDGVLPSYPADEVLANAPQQENGSFKIQPVLESQDGTA
ncbi:MAG: Asp-tRNA(Asn)/Glu-tRNA(Gln) amidotransferase subunit GatC [Chloroflexota bacterium]